MYSDMLSHQLFLRNIKNLRTGEYVKNKNNGTPIQSVRSGETTYMIANNLNLGKFVLSAAKGILSKVFK